MVEVVEWKKELVEVIQWKSTPGGLLPLFLKVSRRQPAGISTLVQNRQQRSHLVF